MFHSQLIARTAGTPRRSWSPSLDCSEQPCICQTGCQGVRAWIKAKGPENRSASGRHPARYRTSWISSARISSLLLQRCSRLWTTFRTMATRRRSRCPRSAPSGSGSDPRHPATMFCPCGRLERQCIREVSESGNNKKRVSWAVGSATAVSDHFWCQSC